MFFFHLETMCRPSSGKVSLVTAGTVSLVTVMTEALPAVNVAFCPIQSCVRLDKIVI